MTEPPDFPRNLHVVDKGSRYIKIAWTTSQDGNSPIKQYIIEYKTSTGNNNDDDHCVTPMLRIRSIDFIFTEVWHDHTIYTSVSGSHSYGHVTGLRPAVTYQFRIYAENELGKSQASDVSPMESTALTMDCKNIIPNRRFSTRRPKVKNQEARPKILKSTRSVRPSSM